MAGNTITSADSEFILSIDGLYNAVALQGYMADRAFETSGVETKELVLGVDGHLSAGYIPYTVPMVVAIMPDSPSNDIFEQWVAAERAGRKVLKAQGTILLPAIGRRYSLKDGYLTNVQLIPTAGKVLQGRPFGITWNLIAAARV